MGILDKHLTLKFPGWFFNPRIPPLNRNKPNSLIPKPFVHPILNCYWSFGEWQIWLNFNRPILDHIIGIWMIFLSIKTWNTLWMYFICGDSASLYTTLPTRLKILNGPTYLRLSFPFLSNLVTPFQGDTLRNIGYPSSKFISFRSWSTYFFFRSWATINCLWIISIFSFVCWTNSGPKILLSPTSS